VKLLTFYRNDEPTLGIKTKIGIIDIAQAATNINKRHIPTDITDLITLGDSGLKQIDELIKTLGEEQLNTAIVDESTITYAPAVTRPSKIICIGLNYRKHADETKLPHPEEPVLFSKFPNALVGHFSEVVIPRTTERLDYEVELCIVIGKRAKNVSESAALDYVFGYCTANDLSARDLQKRSSQWLLGKTADGFAPVGPSVVTKDDVPNPNALRLTTTVNGNVYQDSNTADMIFNCEQLISYVSHHMTLEPGDIILTGTPEGVIIGRPKEERHYLQPGDVVTVEVEGLGALTTKFIADEKTNI